MMLLICLRKTSRMSDQIALRRGTHIQQSERNKLNECNWLPWKHGQVCR